MCGRSFPDNADRENAFDASADDTAPERNRHAGIQWLPLYLTGRDAVNTHTVSSAVGSEWGHSPHRRGPICLEIRQDDSLPLTCTIEERSLDNHDLP